jgi:predicted nucleic acid-binding Zn ribbon protein
MMRDFNALGNVLEKVLTGLELGSRTREFLALIMWPEIVGESIARITSVQAVRNGVLQVDVESPVWAQELQFYKPDMISRINAQVGPGAIQDIHFRVRALKRKPVAAVQAPGRPRRGTQGDVQLTFDDCREIQEIGQRVSDPDLQDALKGTMASYRRLQHWMEARGWQRCGTCQALYQRKRGCPYCA